MVFYSTEREMLFWNFSINRIVGLKPKICTSNKTLVTSIEVIILGQSPREIKFESKKLDFCPRCIITSILCVSLKFEHAAMVKMADLRSELAPVGGAFLLRIFRFPTRNFPQNCHIQYPILDIFPQSKVMTITK